MNEFWTLFLLSLAALLLGFSTSSSAAAGIGSCPEKCGNVSIPYPFGIGQGCYREIAFSITCHQASDGRDGDRPFIGNSNLEVINLSVVPAQARIYGFMSYNCYDRSGLLLPNSSADYIISLGRPSSYRFSNTLNRFTAVGCTTLAYINSSIPGLTYNPSSGKVKDRVPYISQCVSLCDSRSSLENGAECAGVGCCQTNIPKGLTDHNVAFDYLSAAQGFGESSTHCSFGFLAEKDWYIFNASDVNSTDLYYRNNNGKVPLVLDWAIGGSGDYNEAMSCMQAELNLTDFACKSHKSYCLESTNAAPGYTCNCSDGYQGNPYISHGCQDIDECMNKEQYGCFGYCTNSPGNFSCSCPAGKHGNYSIPEGCHRRSFSAIVTAVVFVLCCFIVIAVMFVVYEFAKFTRVKRECFEQNGGLLLQEQISSDESVLFKIFSLKEIKKATNNFHRDNVIGRGGQGEVYLGFLKDDRKVAIKTSNVTDIKNKKDFVREMYILSLINHKHVIKILGCCLEGEVPILVYEYLSGGTLLQNIQNGRMPMSFRPKVAIDCASALAYLHSDASDKILHRDIKSVNILLEGSVVKLADFGASVFPSKYTTEETLPGTFGYIDPESVNETGQLTEKSDVYSFAVVILELLSGRKAIYNEVESGNRTSLVQYFKEKGLANIVDERIKSEVTEEQIDEFAGLLRWCLKEKGEERPEMTTVVASLRRMRDMNPNLSQKFDTANTVLPVFDSIDSATDSSSQYLSTNQHPVAFGSSYQHLR